MTPTWTERVPSPGARIERPDGRVCILKGREYHEVSRKNTFRTAVLATFCRDQLPIRQMSGITAYPMTTDAEATCAKCISERARPTFVEHKPHHNTR